MIPTRLSDALLRLSADLEALRVSWALIGGLAVSARAEPRMTRDVDVVVAVDDDAEAESVIARLRDRGHFPETVMEHRDVGRLATVRLVRKGEERGVVTDLLFASSGIEPEIAREAERIEILPGFSAPVATVAHLLALKVLALRPDRPQDRPQDFADIRELLRVATAKDVERVRGALELIARRGFDRGKDLELELRAQLREAQARRSRDR